MFKKPDLLIWDWDGTLVDSLSLIYEAHNHVRTSFGEKKWSFGGFQKVAHYSTQDIYPSLYGEKAEEATSLLYRFFEEKHLEHTKVIEGAKECLDIFMTLSVPMILVSNKKHEYLLKEVKHFVFSPYFLSVVGAGYAAKDKPDKAPVMKALLEANIPPDSLKTAYYIGDSQTDIDSSKNLPFKTLTYIIGQNKTVGEDIRFPTLADFIKTVDPEHKLDY